MHTVSENVWPLRPEVQMSYELRCTFLISYNTKRLRFSITLALSLGVKVMWGTSIINKLTKTLADIESALEPTWSELKKWEHACPDFLKISL